MRAGVVSSIVQARKFALIAAVLTFSLVFSAEALAKRVVVTGFAGPGGGRARSYVLRVLRRYHTIVSVRKFARTARRLHVRLSGRRNVRKICHKANIDAVVYGRVVRRRGRWWLRIWVRDGATGRVVKREVIRLRGPRMNASSRHTTRYFVRKAMGRVEGVSDEEEEASSAGPTIPPVRDEEKVRKKKHKKKREKPAPKWSYLTAVEAGLVLDVVARRFVLYPKDSNPDYKTAGVIPPVGLYFEVFPGAFLTKTVGASDVGIGFWWTRSFGVTSDTDRSDERYETVYQKVDFWLTYRWNILAKPSSPELRLDLGMGNLRFMIDAPPGSGDPIKAVGVRFWYVMPRLRGKFPILTNRLAALAGFAFMHPFQIGPTAQPWAYGGAKAWGMDLTAGLDVRLINFVHLMFEGRFTYFGITYLHDPANWDDAGWNNADRARDMYYGFMVRLAVEYAHFVPKNFL